MNIPIAGEAFVITRSSITKNAYARWLSQSLQRGWQTCGKKQQAKSML
ncbi:hypothetical protein L579_1028 [Pantoea sp. AS-PWVM4]|nr:hypothetical protein L579_1028 [Pantoea sp. AS-PWVM4]